MATKWARAGNAAAPQIANNSLFSHAIVLSETSASVIHADANAPVIPSSMSATVPYAFPLMILRVSKPTIIPVNSNHLKSDTGDPI